MRSCPGWTRLSAPGDKCSTVWRHDETGWLVRHCGHPTANWPYHGETPKGRMLVSHNGLGFRRLELAMDAVEAVVAGAKTTRARSDRYGVLLLAEYPLGLERAA